MAFSSQQPRDGDPASGSPLSILVIDDDEVLRNRLEKSFSRRGYHVTVADGMDLAIRTATALAARPRRDRSQDARCQWP